MNYRIQVKVESKVNAKLLRYDCALYTVSTHNKLMVVQNRCIYTINHNSKENVKEELKQFNSGIVNVYTREILSLMGGIKEIHEENCICSKIFTGSNRGRAISE